MKRKTAGGRATEIYVAAADIINEKGFDGTSMNDIADAVKLTKAGLYYYVKNKRDLLRTIMNFAMDAVENEVVEPARSIADPEERIRAVVTGHVELITEYGGAITILSHETEGLGPSARRTIIARKRAYLDFVRATLRSLKRRRRLRGLNVDVAALNLFGTVLGVARWYRRDGRMSGKRVASETADFVMNGLIAP